MILQNKSEKPPQAVTRAAASVMLTVKTGRSRRLAPQQLAGFTDSQPSRGRRLSPRQQLVRFTASLSRRATALAVSRSRSNRRVPRHQLAYSRKIQETVGRGVLGDQRTQNCLRHTQLNPKKGEGGESGHVRDVGSSCQRHQDQPCQWIPLSLLSTLCQHHQRCDTPTPPASARLSPVLSSNPAPQSGEMLLLLLLFCGPSCR
ncbi:testis-specific gene A8 protein-like [Xyrichtys novacula]|uniref:Testis-specific gene A8 protein-like n=1 Tax=Xyrichtys novacula TaxID=13765 RepID=A0AAV1G1S1_XYRNO|nr:testis-specific gene A8 protein-like [Xyrichtys novacula]